MPSARSGSLRTVVLASRKGGAGKTTLAAHLAVEAERQRAGSVVIIDLDPMAGLASWWNARKADTPAAVRVGQGGLKATLGQLQQQGVSLAIIDTPPAADQSIAAVIDMADLVVVPVIPSPHDLRAIGETLGLIEGQETPLVFVLNNASTRARLTHQASSALSQYGTVAPVLISTRQDFRSAMIDGLTVGELPRRGKSADEVTELWKYIASRLKKKGAKHGVSAAA